MGDRHKISVIIPTYNSEKFIEEVVESVFRQSLQPDELIISEDGSTDNTLRILRKFKQDIVILSHKHTGKPTRGRNNGVRIASGDFIAFLDHDDLWPENKLELQYKIFCEDDSVEVVLGFTQIFRQKNDNSHTWQEFFMKPKLNFLLSASLIKRSVLDRIGLFDETMKYWGSDGDWFLRAIEQETKFYFHNEIALFWRYHQNNTSAQKENRNHAVIEVLKKSLDRRRLNKSEIKSLLLNI